MKRNRVLNVAATLLLVVVIGQNSVYALFDGKLTPQMPWDEPSERTRTGKGSTRRPNKLTGDAPDKYDQFDKDGNPKQGKARRSKKDKATSAESRNAGKKDRRTKTTTKSQRILNEAAD